jgi:phosphoribosylglycinamide formyltransferase-1
MSLPKLAVLISGRGSNMLAIAAACRSGGLPCQLAAVVTDRGEAAGIAAAAALGIKTAALAAPDAPRLSSVELESKLEAILATCSPDFIALAGFMRVLSAAFVERHLGKLVNIHPSLLPAYRGLHTHRRVLEAREPFHGASVHFVVPQLDAGPVVLQARLAVRADDNESSLSARVQTAEHIIYPRALGWLAEGRCSLRANRAWLDGRPLAAPIVEAFS